MIGRRGFLAGAATAAAGASLVGPSPAYAVAVASGVTKFDFPTDRKVRVLVAGGGAGVAFAHRLA
ncbi:hypothetical protein ACQPXH_08685 [Nocardia sp. CA-135953]|uniref:hypothetical protein n=1 Tax=Nocardia sp. CA-135953 TaxID=3239978 RepID=UPI003D990C98